MYQSRIALGRKMIPLSLCLLLTVSALAAEVNEVPSVIPIDQDDDLHLRVNPTHHIFHKYQQTFLDQPPKEDVREEDVGRYMYRKKTTPATPLSTTLIPFEEVDLQFLPFNEIQPHKRFPPVNIITLGTRKPPPPPTTPKWEDHTQRQWYYTEPVPVKTHAPAETTTANKEAETEETSTTIQVEVKPESTVAPSTSKPIVVLPVRKHTAVTPEVHRPVHTWHESHSHRANRGNHKFRWDDVLAPLPEAPKDLHKARTSMTPSPVHMSTVVPAVPSAIPVATIPRAAAAARPPPPTLTPWSGDNLGK